MRKVGFWPLVLITVASLQNRLRARKVLGLEEWHGPDGQSTHFPEPEPVAGADSDGSLKESFSSILERVRLSALFQSTRGGRPLHVEAWLRDLKSEQPLR